MYLGALASVQCPGIPALPRQGPEGIIERSASYGKSEQFFFGFGNRATGGPVTKQGISRCLVNAIKKINKKKIRLRSDELYLSHTQLYRV